MTLIPPIETIPNQTDYTTWIYTYMNVSPTILPSSSPYIPYSFNLAVSIVNGYINQISPFLYVQAVYNLAGDFLCNSAQDTAPSTYWANLRTSFGINNFTPGLISAANDEDTSSALLVPATLQNLTLGDLQNLKTPYGRYYLAIAQSVGSMWGIT